MLLLVDLCSGGSRIFPGGGRQLPKVLLFFNFVPGNCMKMKEFGLPGGRASLAPPLRSANAMVSGHLQIFVTKIVEQARVIWDSR